MLPDCSIGMFNRSSGFGQAVTALLAYLSTERYSFVTVTPSTHARIVARQRNDGASTLRDAFGWNTPFEANLLPPELRESLQAAGVIEPRDAFWISCVRVASVGAQLFAHSAYPTGEADSVFFGPDTYRFIAAISRRLHEGEPVKRVAEIGCGTGAAGIVIARARPEAQVFLGDINSRALQFTTINVAAAKVSNVSVQYSDILAQLPGDFDFIVANPPYMVDVALRAYRHGGAAHGTELSLRILDVALERLLPSGTGLLYSGAPVSRGVDVLRAGAEDILSKHGAKWTYDELDPDVFGEELEQPAYASVERIASVVIEFRKS